MKRAPKRGIFSTEECRQLFRAAEGEGWWGAFLSMALGTGLRWGELAGLTRDDVDLKGPRVHVRQSWSPKANAVQDPKTGKGRVVPMSADLLAIMKAHMETRSAEGWGPQSLVFPGENRRHMRHFHGRWVAFLKRARVEHRPFHCCRHSFASHALKAGVRPENVQRWLGHATLSMTIDTYREYIADHESDARDVERLGEILC
jgi:integrase